MRTFARHCALMMLAVLLLSCGGRRIIPRGEMADIVAEMLLADQWLADHPDERSKTDTTLFYDPVLKRYGYSFEDWDRSVQYYLRDPEKFAKVFRNATNKLRDKRDYYRRITEKYASIKEFNDAIKGYKAVDFDADTLLWHRPVTDSVLLDSLRREKLLRDSLEREAFVLDSLRLDSLRRDSLLKVSRHREPLSNDSLYMGSFRGGLRDSLVRRRLGERKLRTIDF